MALVDVALNCVRRGWYVFPCVPRTKRPLGGLVPNGVLDASNDEVKVRKWWAAKPDANVAIACGPSGLSVVDCDHGNATEADARAWMERAGLPTTYTVHTGRRSNPKDGTPEYGVQLYYSEAMPSVGEFSLAGGTGQIKSHGGYVMAAGSIHPDSGESYELLMDGHLAPLPPVVRSLKTERKPVEDDGGPITENRNIRLTSIGGKLRNAELSAELLETTLLQINEERCVPPLSEEEVQRIAASVSRYAIPEPDVEVTIGGKSAAPKEPVDPWEKYHTLDELLSVPPGKFIVDGILYDNSITALAGYAGDRKSIVSLNLAASCVTGHPFMGKFAVANPPKRVIYLCPEMGLRELAKLSKNLGMLPYVGKTLFFRSLDKSGKIKLSDLTPVELDGSLVILDTAVRFIEGKENDPQDMAVFSDELFRLRNKGATVWVLFHSSKASVAQELSLQNAVRGSSEIAAMLSMCWATRLNEPAKRFDSTSRMYPLKVREFEALPFDFGCDRVTAACSIIGEPAPVAVLKDRKADERRAIIRELVQHDPDIGVNRIQAVLKERTGSGGNAKWVSTEKKLILRGTTGGSVLREE